MSGKYQVIAECAHVPVTDHSGVTATHLLYKGAFVPDNVNPERLKFLIDGGFVEEAGKTPIAPNASVEQDPARGLESVTSDVLRGGKADEPSRDPALEAADRAAEAMRSESGTDKAAESPRAASDGTEAEARRADARTKLAESGGVPTGRSSDAVMVEYLVSKGYERAEVEKADRAQLKGLVEAAK